MFAFLDLGLETDLLICVLCRRSVSGVDIDPDRSGAHGDAGRKWRYVHLWTFFCWSYLMHVRVA